LNVLSKVRKRVHPYNPFRTQTIQNLSCIIANYHNIYVLFFNTPHNPIEMAVLSNSEQVQVVWTPAVVGDKEDIRPSNNHGRRIRLNLPKLRKCEYYRPMRWLLLHICGTYWVFHIAILHNHKLLGLSE